MTEAEQLNFIDRWAMKEMAVIFADRHRRFFFWAYLDFKIHNVFSEEKIISMSINTFLEIIMKEG